MTSLIHDLYHAADAAHGHVNHDRTYVITAGVLALITAAATATYFVKDFPLWNWGEGIGVTAFLLICMVAKFIGVVSIFMHLKFDNKILSWCFYSGLVLAIFVYIGVMTAFRLWWSGSHMVTG